MPTYQYVCTQCGRDLEVQQSFSDASLTECPTCQGRLRKVFNAVGVVFKGSGFYRNDSRSDGKGGSSTTSSTSSSDGGSKDSGSGDKAKPAEKKSDSSSTGSGGTSGSSSTTTSSATS
ncbi:FmdB family zinc ribbon protein [Solicola sp. PLA-1-18]|uniref:FmdB family zinc ribbon protein n=1 Tax=Solicola sp. PLA-1-18 TaxID=3380532 RepID=UPI003B76E461